MTTTDTTPPVTPTTATTATTKSINNSTRPKFYKLKQDYTNYQLLCVEHLDQSINSFDYYMEFTPTILKRIFSIGFLLNKLLVIVLVYCVFYNTIWWYSNSTSNNLAINYQIIDSTIFFILIYINFHEFLISNLLLRQLVFHLLKSFHIMSTLRLKMILNYFEIILKFLIICFNFLYLVYYAQYTLKFSLLFLVPHFFNLVYYSFNYEVKILNRVLFTNNFLPSSASSVLITSKNNKSNNVADADVDGGDSSSGNDVSIVRKIYQLLRSIPQTSHIQIQKNYLFQNFNNNTNITCLTTSVPPLSQINGQQQQQTVSTTRSHSPPTTTTTAANATTSTLPSSLTLLSTVRHSCIKDTASLREETELFTKLFNSRFKEICFRTFEIIFYNLIIPRLCVPDYINIRNFEFYSYVFIVFINTFISYWLYYIPISFLISLNRNAEHLGEWEETQKLDDNDETKVDDEQKQQQQCCWFDTKFYFEGDSISYAGKCYRVKSKFCISIPNYKLHKKFFKYFHDPFLIVSILASLKIACIVLLGLVTYYEAKWYNIAVNMLYVILNFHVLYIITRDWIVLYVKKFAKVHDE